MKKLLIAFLFIPCGIFAQSSTMIYRANQTLAKSLKGAEKWLKIDVIKAGENVTYIGADSQVYYHLPNKFSFRRSPRYATAEDFLAEYRQQPRNYQIDHWRAGAKVIIHKVEIWETFVELGLTNAGGNKSVITLDFDRRDFVPNDIRGLLRQVLADSANWRQEKTVALELGMTVDEVIRAKGQPKTRAAMDEKVILVYDDVKITFQDGKLVDVQ